MNCCNKIEFQKIEKLEKENISSYHDRAYIIFKKSLIDSNIMYNNLPIKVRELPFEDNKVQGFFHVISELDKKLGIRMYKEERVKYIPFISKMITEYDKCNTCSNKCTKIKVWTAPYKNKVNRIKFYFEEENYIVILEKRPNYYQLVSAYVVDREDRKIDILKEYNKYK